MHNTSEQNQPAIYLALAVWFGVLTGVGEVSLLGIKKFYQGGTIFHGPDVAWMAPLADSCLFAVAGLLFAIVAWRWPQLDLFPKAGFVFTFLGALSLLLMLTGLHPYAAMLLAGGIAVQMARFIKAQRVGFANAIRRTTPPLVVLMTVLGAGLHGWQWLGVRRTEAQLRVIDRDAPNVLLVVLDTVRAQNMSLYGYERRTTPNLERLAKSGVVFERALSTSPWTLPSHASMFTGRYPHELSADYSQPMSGKYPTLAEVFSVHGYLTAGFVANLWFCTYEMGLNRGFLRYEDYPISVGEILRSSSLVRAVRDTKIFEQVTGYHDILGRKSAAEVNDSFLAWLSQVNGRPFFAFLNYYDAHHPYLPPEPFATKFGTKFVQRKPSIISEWNEFSTKISPQEALAELHAYDGSIAYLDHRLGILFDEMEKRGLLNKTVVVITSDHGEQFGEHGLFNHANSLYRPLLEVPLFISFPSRVPGAVRIHEWVTLRDVAATILELVQLAGGPSFPGTSLSRYWAGKVDLSSPSPLLSEVSKNTNYWKQKVPVAKGDMTSLVADGVHYIKNGDGREELYDFDVDPMEEHDLSGSEKGQRALSSFRNSLDRIIKRP